jgi:hypothetical protein
VSHSSVLPGIHVGSQPVCFAHLGVLGCWTLLYVPGSLRVSTDGVEWFIATSTSNSASPNNKTDHHEITEILLKVTLFYHPN